MRYTLTEETHKDGRKKLKQWCVWDTIEQRVVARYASQKDAEKVIETYKLKAS